MGRGVEATKASERERGRPEGSLGEAAKQGRAERAQHFYTRAGFCFSNPGRSAAGGQRDQEHTADAFAHRKACGGGGVGVAQQLSGDRDTARTKYLYKCIYVGLYIELAGGGAKYIDNYRCGVGSS